MSYREPAHMSKLATVLRYYAAIIESGTIDPPPEHLLTPQETVDDFRRLGMELDLEAAARLAEIQNADLALAGALPAPQSLPNCAQPAPRPAEYSAERVRAYRQAAQSPEGDGTDDGEAGGIGSRLAPGTTPRPRRRRGPQ